MPAPSSARNQFRGRVCEIVSAGPLWRVTIDVDGAKLVAVLKADAYGHGAVELARR